MKRAAWSFALPRELKRELERRGIYAEHIQYAVELKENGDLYFHLQPRAKPWALSLESE